MSEHSLAVVLPERSARAGLWAGTQTMTARSFRLSLRKVDGLITGFAIPVILMLMFVYLFGGAIHTGTRYLDYVVPGVLLVSASFGVGTTAVTVTDDLGTGIIDRFRSIDVRGEALITGHVIASVARNLLSALLVFAVALAIGFRSNADPAAWLGAIAILALFVAALTWLAAALGILARSSEAANAITFIFAFLAYPSSAFVPIDTMPTWLRGFARHQPFTPVIDTIRGLLTGTPVGSNAWQAAGWSIGIIAGSILLAGALYRRRTR